MKYNKGFAPVLILVIVLGVLVVGGVAYFAGKSSAPKNEVSDNYFPTTEEQNYTSPTTNNNPPAQTEILQYKYNNKIISYDSNLWRLVEKRFGFL